MKVHHKLDAKLIFDVTHRVISRPIEDVPADAPGGIFASTENNRAICPQSALRFGAAIGRELSKLNDLGDAELPVMVDFASFLDLYARARREGIDLVEQLGTRPKAEVGLSSVRFNDGLLAINVRDGRWTFRHEGQIQELKELSYDMIAVLEASIFSSLLERRLEEPEGHRARSLLAAIGIAKKARLGYVEWKTRGYAFEIESRCNKLVGEVDAQQLDQLIAAAFPIERRI